MKFVDVLSDNNQKATFTFKSFFALSNCKVGLKQKRQSYEEIDFSLNLMKHSRINEVNKLMWIQGTMFPCNLKYFTLFAIQSILTVVKELSYLKDTFLTIEKT